MQTLFDLPEDPTKSHLDAVLLRQYSRRSRIHLISPPSVFGPYWSPRAKMLSIGLTPESLAVFIAKFIDHALEVTVRAFDEMTIDNRVLHYEFLHDFVQLLSHRVSI